MLQWVAVGCSGLQWVAVGCSGLYAVCCSGLQSWQWDGVRWRASTEVTMVQCVILCCSMLPCIATCCRALQCVAGDDAAAGFVALEDLRRDMGWLRFVGSLRL